MADFIHLHNHTEYSLLDGAIRLTELIEQAREFGQPAVALTDHGSLYGMIRFYRQAKRAGIKPILGCEVYLTPGSRLEKKDQTRYHLILLAENNRGYHNLIQLVSRGHLEGFYYKPRVDKELLARHAEGLIATSACLQGELAVLLTEERRDEAEEALQEYLDIFGRKNFFIELQDHGLEEQKRINPILIEMADEFETGLIASNDCHYLNQEDAELHDLLLALQTGTTIQDEDRMQFRGDQFYFKSTAEMQELFGAIPEALENTVKIAERCKVELEFDQFHLPEYPDIESDGGGHGNGKGKEKGSENEVKRGESRGRRKDEGYKSSGPEELLRYYCDKALGEKLPGDDEARRRMEEELDIIIEMGYASYFLIVRDFVVEAERRGIRVGPGRGSAAGSLVSYLLGITKINPLDYGLLFERFLNPERLNLPDIDIDFDDRRDEIIEYVSERYGQERVAQIGTFGTMAARGAVRDVGRGLGMDYDKVDRVAKKIPARPGITLDEALKESSELEALAEEDRQVGELLEKASRLEGMPRHISTHAAGVIIGPKPLVELVPLQLSDGTRITQLPMEEIEELGLLKMDFLGLRNLTVIEDSLKRIEENHGEEIEIDNLELDNQEVYRMLGRGQTAGVFQMESQLFQDLNRRLKPDRFGDLIALLALGRPGPLGSNMVEDYIECRHGEKEPEYLHPLLEPILKDTFGLILYQEQVMEIASELGGFSLGEADILRRGMGKKKEELVARERERFVTGAREKGIAEETAHEIYDQMAYFSGYGFNKSHSAAYAMIAYQTAFLKSQYPGEFMAALLSSVMNNLDKVADYISAAREMGLKVLPPDINESGHDFVNTGRGEIRFGLKAVKNLGGGAIEAIISGREQGHYQDILDFLERVDLSAFNRTSLESLMLAGAFDSLPRKRSQLVSSCDELYSRFNSSRAAQVQGQTSFFDLVEDKEEFYSGEFDFPEMEEYTHQEKLELEREYLGVYVSGHPLAPYYQLFAYLGCLKEADSKKARLLRGGFIKNIREHITKNGRRMAFIAIEDISAELDVVVFPDIYRRYSGRLTEGDVVLISGRRDEDNLIAEELVVLEAMPLVVEFAGMDDAGMEGAGIEGAGEISAGKKGAGMRDAGKKDEGKKDAGKKGAGKKGKEKKGAELKKIKAVVQEAQGGGVPLILAGETGEGGRQILLLPRELWPAEEKRDYFIEEFERKGFRVRDFS